MSFTVTTEPRDDRQLAVTIEVSKERVEQELRKAATRVAGQYRIPGFRQGKAPYHIVVQQVGLANLYSEFVDELGQELFRKAIEQEAIEPYAQSSLEDIQFEPLTYRMLVPLEPEVELGDYRALRVDEEQLAIDEETLNERLEAYREQYAGWQDVDRPSQYGDTMTIDVKSVVIPEEGAEEAEESVVLDETDWDVTPDQENPMEPAGFDEQLLGLKAGDEKEFVLGWPADGQSIYAGKQARFHVKVKNVQAYEKPELNDAFAQLVGPDYETLDDLKKSIRESIEASEKSRLENEYHNKVLDALVEISKLTYPPVVIEDQIDSMMQDTDQRLRQIGIDGIETFLRQTNQSEEQYRERLRDEGTKIARRNLVLSEVVKQEKFTVDDAEVEARIRQMLGLEADAEIDESAQAVADMLRQGAGRNMIVSQLLAEKAINLLVALARGEEVPAPGEHDTGEAEAEAADSAAATEDQPADAETEEQV